MPKEKSLESVIAMEKAVELLGLRMDGTVTSSADADLVPTDVSEINILCPACSGEHSVRRLTLNINFEKGAFGCPRCGFSGGVYKLVSYYTGWEYNECAARIKKGELGNYIPKEGDSPSARPVENVGRPIAPLKQRNEVYEAMLDILRLSAPHRENLIKRGLDEESIERIGFKTLPKYADPTVIAKKLVTAGLDLRGVPGFGINESGEWAMARLPDGGFLIPSRNGQGKIMGCQVRFDHPGARIPKFGYFTSGGMSGGTKAGVWCSWAGENLLSREQESPFDVILIEGPLKSYIVNHITGVNVIAVPGVSALKKVPPALQSMMSMGLRTVHIAYDMDQDTNEAVRKQLNRLREILDTLGVSHKTLRWDAEYKGLDDWVVSPMFQKILNSF